MPQRPVDTERRVQRHEVQAPCGARAVDRAHELGLGRLDRQCQLESACHEDLPDERHRTQVRAREDHALSLSVRPREAVPTVDDDHRGEALVVERRDLEDLEVAADLIDEYATRETRTIRCDDGQVRADGGSRARGCQVGDRAHGLGDRRVPRRRDSGEDPLRRVGERARRAHRLAAPSERDHIGRKMYH